MSFSALGVAVFTGIVVGTTGCSSTGAVNTSVAVTEAVVSETGETIAESIVSGAVSESAESGESVAEELAEDVGTSNMKGSAINKTGEIPEEVEGLVGDMVEGGAAGTGTGMNVEGGASTETEGAVVVEPIDVGGVERQYSLIKTTMPDGYQYYGCDGDYSFFLKDAGTEEEVRAFVWSHDIDTAELEKYVTADADAGLRDYVNVAFQDKILSTLTGKEKRRGSSQINDDFHSTLGFERENQKETGYSIITTNDEKAFGVVCVTPLDGDAAEKESLDIIEKIEFNGLSCEEELNFTVIE